MKRGPRIPTGPAPITCEVCGEQVSKRQSLHLPGIGRVCRHHEEVAEYKHAAAQKGKEEESMVELAVTTVRMHAMVNNCSLFASLSHSRSQIPPEIYSRVKHKVLKLGRLEVKDIGDTIFGSTVHRLKLALVRSGLDVGNAAS
jgi:hypothetical protein